MSDVHKVRSNAKTRKAPKEKAVHSILVPMHAPCPEGYEVLKSGRNTRGSVGRKLCVRKQVQHSMANLATNFRTGLGSRNQIMSPIAPSWRARPTIAAPTFGLAPSLPEASARPIIAAPTFIAPPGPYTGFTSPAPVPAPAPASPPEDANVNDLTAAFRKIGGSRNRRHRKHNRRQRTRRHR